MSLLATTFTGIPLINPFLLSSAPPTSNRAMISRAFEAGWGGAVIKSLSQVETPPQSNVRPRIEAVKYNGRIIGFVDIELGTMRSLDDWLHDIHGLKKDYPDRALVASMLYGGAPVEAQWREAASSCAESGADALELNFSCPHGGSESGGVGSIAQSPEAIRRIIGWVRAATTIPIWVKMPAMPGLPEAAKTCLAAGADAISLINSVHAVPGIDIDTCTPLPAVGGKGSSSGLGGPAIKPISLHAVLQTAQAAPGTPITGIGGISNWHDAVEFFLAGAGLVQLCSEVLLHGYGIIDGLCAGLEDYLQKKEFTSVDQIRGLALPNLALHKDLRREPRVVAFNDTLKCRACGMCFVACKDAGYQAINGSRGEASRVDAQLCDGCGLCVQICPAGSLSLREIA